MFQQEQKNQLRHGLASLPSARNDYEIVIPEQDTSDHTNQGQSVAYIEDQADVDNRREAELDAQSESLW